jgi:hypothetical protein
MHSDLIGKIDKARHYAKEPERFALDVLEVAFHGGNHDHTLTLADGAWSCDCTAFHRHHTCAHMMALQRILAPMLSNKAREAVPLAMHSELISMIEKSRRYADESQRIKIRALRGSFHGSNNDHALDLTDDVWSCDCTSFRLYQTCAHVMALQKILGTMLTAEALQPLSPVAEHQIAGALS